MSLSRKLLFIGIPVLAIAGFALWFFLSRNVPAEQEVFALRQYDFAEDSARALAELDPERQAVLVSGVETSSNIIALTFDGVNEIDIMDEVIRLARQYQITGSFFMEGVGVAEYARFAFNAKQNGYEVGSYTLFGKKHMDTLPVEDMVEDFVYSSALLAEAIKEKPLYLKCNNTSYTDTVLMAAAASGFEYAVKESHILNYQSFSSYEMARDYIKRLPNGSVVSIKMRGVLDEEEFTPVEKEQAVGRESGLEETTVIQEPVDETQQLLNVVEWVCRAIWETGRGTVQIAELSSLPPRAATEPQTYVPPQPARLSAQQIAQKEQERKEQQEQAVLLTRAEELLLANKGRLAEQINLVYTTERALAYTFYGIENQTALIDVLDRMQTLDINGTFFVSEADVQQYPTHIAAILEAGHEVGLALLPRDSVTTENALTHLLRTGDLLKGLFDIEPTLAMVPFGDPSDIAREAIAARGLTLLGYSTGAVRSANEYSTKADEVIPLLFSSGVDSLRRGDIIYYRLDFYKESDTLAGEVLQSIKEKYVDVTTYPKDTGGAEYAYAIKSAGSLLTDHPELLYKYPLSSEKVPAARANAIQPGYLDDLSESAILRTLRRGYIGNPDIIDYQNLPGFTDQQIATLDKTGRIDTGGKNIIFLTFDDWGTDISTNHLLYVLNKHNVKASFFIRTNYVSSNPNLLRAIAAEGHDLGSHTVNHMVLADYDPETEVFISITEAEKEHLQNELVGSYKTMIDIAGDLLNETGTPVVRRFFRAPTLAQSYLGMKTVFDCGYQYSISGDFSSGDYDIQNAEQLLDILKNGVHLYDNTRRMLGPGSIVVMHVSPTASYTAEALDIFLTENEQKPEAERYTFLRLSDYLK